MLVVPNLSDFGDNPNYLRVFQKIVFEKLYISSQDARILLDVYNV